MLTAQGGLGLIGGDPLRAGIRGIMVARMDVRPGTSKILIQPVGETAEIDGGGVKGPKCWDDRAYQNPSKTRRNPTSWHSREFRWKSL